MTPVKQRWLSSRRQETYSHLVSTHLLTAAFCLEYMPLCEAGDIAIRDVYFTPISMRSNNYLVFLFVGFLEFQSLVGFSLSLSLVGGEGGMHRVSSFLIHPPERPHPSTMHRGISFSCFSLGTITTIC